MEETRILIASVISAVISYLLGSMNFAVVISRFLPGGDIRKHGSGNAGMTNMLRTYGIVPAALTALGDFSKGSVAMLISTVIFRHMEAGNVNAGYIAAVFAILGHCFPIYFKFKGGKGVITALGVILTINWAVFIMLLLIAVPLIFITRIVSIGSITGAFALVVLNGYWILKSDPSPAYPLICTILIAGMVLYLHRENIKRLQNGTENRFGSRKEAS